jgi:flagellar biosynthesis protein
MSDAEDSSKAQKQLRAVALKFEMGKDDAPTVLAKGRGLMAEKILALAKKKNIPLYEDPELVEVLSKLDMGNQIAPELYQAVAEVLIFIYRTNQAKMAAKAAPPSVTLKPLGR